MSVEYTEKTKTVERLRSCLVDPEEQIVNILGNSVAQSFFSTGTVGNGFCILTDQRVYFKGKCFIRFGKGFYKKTEEKTVGVGEVTGTGFVHNKAIWAKVLAIIFTVLAVEALLVCIGMFLTPIQNGESVGSTAILGLLVFLFTVGSALLFWYLHKMLNYSLFEISYAGGGIAFDLHWISQQEAQEFQKALNRAKDERKAEELRRLREAVGDSAPQAVQTAPVSNVAQELRQFKELLDSGVITEEEFEAKKKQLLNL